MKTDSPTTYKWPTILKKARLRKNLTLRAVEKLTGISNPYLSQLENGQIKEPGFFIMIRLLSVYGITVKDNGNTWEYDFSKTLKQLPKDIKP
jgi:transcriptional regulator with XRE-family HTH domain